MVYVTLTSTRSVSPVAMTPLTDRGMFTTLDDVVSRNYDELTFTEGVGWSELEMTLKVLLSFSILYLI